MFKEHINTAMTPSLCQREPFKEINFAAKTEDVSYFGRTAEEMLEDKTR